MKIYTARKNCFQGVFFSQGLHNEVLVCLHGITKTEGDI